MIYWDILGYTGIYWDILGYTGMYWKVYSAYLKTAHKEWF